MYQRLHITNKHFTTQYFSIMRISDAAHILASHTMMTSVLSNPPPLPHTVTPRAISVMLGAVPFMVL